MSVGIKFTLQNWNVKYEVWITEFHLSGRNKALKIMKNIGEKSLSK